MTLKTSYRNINPAFGMFKSTLRKNAGLIILMCVGVLIYCPGYFIADIVRYRAADSADMSQIFILLLSFAGCAAVLLFNLLNSMFLYSKRSSDVFLSLPLTRTELLISRCAAGFVFGAIPVLVGYTSVSVLNSLVGAPVDAMYIINNLLATLAFMAVCSVLSMVFVSCAGSAFDLGVSFLTVNIGVVLATLIALSLFDSFVVGFNFSNEYEIIKWLSPFAHFTYYMTGLLDNEKVGAFGYYGYCVALIAVFGALSVFLFKKRKAERGGQAYAFRFMPIICGFLISICCGYGLGMIFGQGEIKILFWIFATIGAVISAVIYGAITKRGFKGIKSFVVSGIAAVLTMVLVCIVAATGGFGYETRMPEKADIDSVIVTVNGYGIEFKNSDLPFGAHNQILDDKLYWQEDYSDEYINLIHIHFDYALKGGKEFKRSYRLNTYDKDVSELLYKFYSCDERYDSFLKVLDDTKENVVDFYSYESGQGNDFSTYVTKAECRKIIEIYHNEEKKYPDIGKRYFGGNYAAYYDMVVQDSDNWNYYSMELYLADDFPETRAYVESLDLKSRIDQNDLLLKD